MQRLQPRTLIKHLAVVAAMAAAAAMLPAAAQGRPDLVAQSMRDRPFVGGEVLVQFRRGASDADKEAVLRGLGARIVDDVLLASARNDGKGDLHLLRLPVGLTVAAALREAGRAPTVDFAEPNWVYTRDAVSNDPYYTNGSLWGMYGNASSPANQYGSQAGEAWAAGQTCGTNNVVVGIIDEGVMITHPDLAANIGTNPGEIAANGVDDDNNGLVDDVNGWDFDGNNNTVFDGVGDDHGTHVAGTIGAAGGNGTGVAGVCWSAKMLIAKFLGNQGGTTANAIKAVDYMTNLKISGLNLVATNNSWGGGGFSTGLFDAIERANTANILFVAAAGNSSVNNDTSPHYPSSYTNENIISVASITSTGALSSFSNYGATSVDLGAPGSGIWSTVPVRSKGKVVASYASYSGTSMATPHVTGAAAMYASMYPGSTAAQIKTAILGSAITTTSLSGKTVTGGRLNVSGF